MSENEKIVRRPFHETIVDLIRDLSFEMPVAALSWLIMETKIPKNHDAIIAAWKEKFPGVDVNDGGIGAAVLINLLVQKEEAEAEAKAKAEAEDRREERLMREDAMER